MLLKALSGCGPAAGEALDCLDLPHVIGSVAGDNTILLVVDDPENTQQVVEELEKMYK